MTRTRNHVVPDVSGEQQLFARSLTAHIQIHGKKRRLFHLNLHFFSRSYQEVVVAFSAQNGREQIHQGLPLNPRPLVIPGTLTINTYINLARMRGLPLLHRRHALIGLQLREGVE